MPGPTRFTIKYCSSSNFIDQIRLLFRDQQVPYYEQLINFHNVNGTVFTARPLRFPCVLDGEQRIQEIGAIMRHLGRQFNLYGNAEEMSFVDEVFDSICDLQEKYKRYIIDDHSEQSVTFFMNTILPEELRVFDVLLHDRTYFLNERISFVDYSMVEMLRLLRNVNGNCLEGFPSVLQFYENMSSRPNIARHLEQMTR
ncbi:Glutathione S-transferase [Trichinella pseudospiralis]|uniref:Glutathione S-transferase n=2 Tax=Trichinella pseudospiralis TaxID=6337 RepID=A0A0V1F3R4_TRIPS|nr:Glutathione S-transferase [Trichinella pseudospiralis]KRY80774.1 Glutathione S-transferase [Trichinella pseudospiralis]KRY80985.1 Glutathione S-transferase [Trichinella pseudospiralis]KRZ02586.1 Glutathione S-transferase [Trichinella pseudospiralis]